MEYLQQNQKNIIEETHLQISVHKKSELNTNKKITILSKNQEKYVNTLEELFSTK